MNAKNLISIAISIMFIIMVFLVLSSSGVIDVKGITPINKIEIKSKESFEKGEAGMFEIKAESSQTIKKIIYISPNKREEQKCNAKECAFTFSESFQEKGVFFIEIQLELSDNRKISEKKKIQVIETGKKCADGTLFEECSEEKPNYCNQGKLEENCSICGCSKGNCIEGKCIYVGVMEISEIALEKSFFKPKEKINLKVKTQEITKGEFEFIVEWEKNEKIEKSENKTKEITCENCQTEFELEIITPEKEGKYTINLKFKEDIYSTENITIRNDSSSPATPTGIIASKSNGKILLGWNKNTEDDLMEYNIYRSKEDTTAYTTYVFAQTVKREETGIELELWGTNYFYLTAVDYYGNESLPSIVIEAK